MFKSVRRSFAKTTDTLIAGLDIGTSKVCCVIARIESTGDVRILGIGYQATRGIRSGTIIDMESLQNAVAQAVHQAEEQADETIEDVYVSISPALCVSKTIKVELDIQGHCVDDADIRKIVQQAVASIKSPNHLVIHTIPINYEIDTVQGIRDPRGMFGDDLKAKIHMLFASKTPLRNLTACVERCRLEVASYVASVYASGLACLVEDELDLGVTLIDLGAGTTSIGVFHNGKLAYVDYIPIGGAHVTSDIARCLSTPLHQAERIKTLYGTTMISPSDGRETIAVPQIGEADVTKNIQQVAKSELTQIIRPRVEEIFEKVKAKIAAHPSSRLAGRRVVLTGGGSLLSGVAEFAGMILEKQTRLGRPLHQQGVPDNARVPSFSTCSGLLTYGQQQKGPLAMLAAKRENDNESTSLGRLSQWWKENF